MPQRSIILLAEDDKNDIFLLRRAFKSAGITENLHIVQNGQEAIDYLSGSGGFTDRQRFPQPQLFILDLKLPLLDGFDVLRWLRGRSEFNGLPIVVLTSSKLQLDVDQSRELGVFDYRVKPHTYEDLVRLLDDVLRCWLVDFRQPAKSPAKTDAGLDPGI